LELVEDAEALRRMQERFAARGRTMPDTNRIQAQVPGGCEVIQNERGTAAGFYLQADGKHLFVVPGVPFEMRGMLEDFILPRLREVVGRGRALRREALKVYGLPESEINERIRGLMVRGRNPLLGLLPNLGTITVEVVALGATAEEAETLAQSDIRELRRLLGQHIISEDGRDLPQVVADLLRERGFSISVAEVGTGGLLAARLTGALSDCQWFRHSSVEPAVPGAGAGALAASARAATGAHIGIGVAPIEFVVAGHNGKLRASVTVAVDIGGTCAAEAFSFVGDRALAREWAADAALGLLRLRLLN
jgi:nicotinamide-nucleotide amidase